MSDESDLWLEKAESDLGHALHSLKDKDFDWAALAAQQAAEKAMKSVCIKKGLGLIKSHDLTVLTRKLKAPKEIIEQCALLNPFYSATRYPDAGIRDLEPETTAKEAIESARKVQQWCKQQTKTLT